MARKSNKKQIVHVKRKSLAGFGKAPAGLVRDLRSLIEQTREAVGQSVNSALVVLYWQVGRRIRKDVLKDERAEYGREIVSALSRQLVADYGRGFSRPNLFRMLRFAEVFQDGQIVSTLSRQLSWSHFVAIIPLEDNLQREFYAEICRLER